MSDATDQLGNYNGTASNVNFNTEGKFGFAGAFNGSSSSILLPNDILSSDFSISTWFYLNNTSGDQLLFEFDHENRVMFRVASTDSNKAYIGNSGYFDPGISFSANQWYHFVLTFSNGNPFKIYVNNVLSYTGGNTNTNAFNNDNIFGAANVSGSGSINGKIDQVRIYNSAISAANVTTLYEEIECPAVAVTNAFNTVLYTGNGGTQSITTGFKPDFTWIKERSGTEWHNLFDSVRGSDKSLYSNETSAQATSTTKLTSFNTAPNGGFSLGSDNNVNKSSSTFVSWNWKAGGPAVQNTDGTITSQVSVNTDAGFSVVSYTGNLQAGASIGHSLGVKPDLIITKSTSNAESWEVWSSALNNGGVGQQLRLNSSNAAFSAADYYSTPDTSKFYVGGYTGTNGNGYTYVSYCFTSIPGYSQIGSYTGTGASTNTIYTNFEPSFLLVKNADGGNSWVIFDNKRSASNTRDEALFPNSASAEYDYGNSGVNFNSTGFSLTQNVGEVNVSGNTYIFLAIA
jgi:hypothetical protein